MINSIIKEISVSLNKEFGDEYTNYIEEVKQGLKEPCFFISCISPTNKLFVGKRYYRRNQFCIQYFPKNNNRKKEECNNVAERLFLCLELINIAGDTVRGTDMKCEIVDGVLNFFINYNLYVYKNTENLPVMEELKEDVALKG